MSEEYIKRKEKGIAKLKIRKKMGNLIKLDNLLKKNRGTKEEKDKNIIDEKHDRDRIFQRSKETSPLRGGGGRQKKYRNRQNNYIDYTKKRDKGQRMKINRRNREKEQAKLEESQKKIEVKEQKYENEEKISQK